MDTLIILPFQLWGLSPHVSRNINPVFHRPQFQNIQVRFTDDAGIFLRRGFILLRDSIPQTHIYSLQISDTFYVFGGGMEKPLLHRADTSSPVERLGTIQAYYDYAGGFKQATVIGEIRGWTGGFVSVYKKGQSLNMLFAGFKNNYFTLQKLNDSWSAGISSPYLNAWYLSKTERVELSPGMPFRIGNLRGFAGLYITRGTILPRYLIEFPLWKIHVVSRYSPFYFEKQDMVVKEHFHGFAFQSEHIYLSTGYGRRLVPYDTTTWVERDVVEGHLKLEFPHLQLNMSRFVHSPIEFMGRLRIFREFHPWMHVKLTPYMDILYMENQFESMDIEDIFHVSVGVMGNFYGAVKLTVSYEGNAGIESLWEGNFYRIFIWIDLED